MPAFRSEASRRLFFVLVQKGLIRGKGVARGAKSILSRGTAKATVLRKSTAGELASQVIDSATGHEFASSVSKAASKAPVVQASLNRLSNRVFGKAGKATFKVKRSVLKALKKNPILSAGVKITGRVGTIASRVGGRASESFISTLTGTPRVIKARKFGQIISDEFIDQNTLRGMGRGIRKSKGAFSKHITKPASELLTGKIVYQNVTDRGPGLGSKATRQYGVLQGLRRVMSKSYRKSDIKNITDPFADTVIKGKARKNIAQLITERRELRKPYVEGVRAAKKANRELLAKGTVTKDIAKQQLKEARKILRSKHKESLAKAGEIYSRKTITDPDTGLVRKIGQGKLVEKYGKLYRGADIDLITTGAVGGATAVGGVHSVKAFGEKLRREKFMREKRREADAVRAQIYTQLRLNHPDWDELDVENAVNLEYRRRQLIQIRAAENVGFREALLSAVPKTEQVTQPRESKIRVIRSSPKRLRSVIVGRKKSSKRK